LEPGSVRGEEIREAQEYGGVRMKMVARLGNARIPIQVDIGFGDAVTPGVREIDYPALLDFPPPRLFAYPRETVIAEKLQAMVLLGAPNTRLKDFYDVWVLARGFAFDGATLAAAIAATFRRRGTAVPSDVPLALTPEFAAERAREQQWAAFLNRIGHSGDAPAFTEVVRFLAEFLVPPLDVIDKDSGFPRRWAAGGPWSQPG
jgi:Nucleotidyl transferase AbiEii toxin, Type IV TA system